MLLADSAAAKLLFPSAREYAAALGQLLSALTASAAEPGAANASAAITQDGTGSSAAPAQAAASTAVTTAQCRRMDAERSCSDTIPSAALLTLPEVAGDLSPTETLRLRVAVAMHYACALLPLERTVAKASQLVRDGGITEQIVLVRPKIV